MINQNIAHYRITGKLGQGGMGEVYCATDTVLERRVAIKVLPKSFAADSARLARFEREAKMLAALNHPNIAVIYGIEESVETHALIMELVEGETLAERLQREPMTVPEALDCCRQIAEALEAAHDKGIIHRDLKPENVKIDEEGKVKVLDFGLAKALADPSLLIDEGINQADSPTLTNLTTVPGQLLGTAPYMSPEQARSRPVDKRSDIWSFGCVLYECLAGKPMFHGETVTETLASIIKGEPDWSALPEDTPPTIELLLRKCLTKDRKRRLHDIADARIDIEQALGDPSSSIIRLGDEARRQVAESKRTPWIWIGPTLVPAVLLVVLLVILMSRPSGSIPPRPVYSELIVPGNHLGFLAISPNGRYMAIDIEGGADPITLRHLDRQGFTQIPGTNDSWSMFFSPDDQAICYPTHDKLWRVALDGSKPFSIAAHSGSLFLPGGAWSDAGDIVYPEAWKSGLVKVPAVGGQPETLTRLKPGEDWHRWPQCLPGGTHVLFTVRMEDAQSGERTLKAAIADLVTGHYQILPLEDNCAYVRYAQSGHLLYVNNHILFAVPFDLDSMTVTGPRKDIIQDVAADDSIGLAHYDISRNGTLVYRSGTFNAEQQSTLKWLYPDGHEEVIATVEGKADGCQLSPDDRYVAMVIKKEADDNLKDIWIMELARKLPIRFTNNLNDDDRPFWSKDGQWIYFRQEREGRWGMWRKRADAPVSPAEFIWEPEGGSSIPGLPRLSREGSHLTYVVKDSSIDIWTVRLDQPNPVERILMGTAAKEYCGEISPDGKWLAFASNMTGESEIYLTTFDDPNSHIRRVSSDGGVFSRWSSSGDRLFFADGRLSRGDAIWSVDVSVEGQSLSTGVPQVFVRLTERIQSWAIDAQGKRVLVIVNEEGQDVRDNELDGDHTLIHVVSNFFTELNEKAPPSK